MREVVWTVENEKGREAREEEVWMVRGEENKSSENRSRKQNKTKKSALSPPLKQREIKNH